MHSIQCLAIKQLYVLVCFLTLVKHKLGFCIAALKDQVASPSSVGQKAFQALPAMFTVQTFLAEMVATEELAKARNGQDPSFAQDPAPAQARPHGCPAPPGCSGAVRGIGQEPIARRGENHTDKDREGQAPPRWWEPSKQDHHAGPRAGASPELFDSQRLGQAGSQHHVPGCGHRLCQAEDLGLGQCQGKHQESSCGSAGGHPFGQHPENATIHQHL